MAYAPADLTDGNVLTATNIKDRIADYRDAVQTDKLHQSKFTDASLRTENIVRPTLINHGYGNIEFLSESGGVKMTSTGTSGFHAMKNDAICNATDSLGPPIAQIATQGGVSVLQAQVKNGQALNNVAQLLGLPGLNTTVRLDEECVVRIKVKLTMNGVPNGASNFEPGLLDTESLQNVFLLMRKPSGAYSLLDNESANTGYYNTTIHDMMLREINLYGHLNIDTTNNATGEYTFVVATACKNISGDARSAIGFTLLGKSSMIVEWDYGKSPLT